MKDITDKHVIIGKFGRLHGLKGWITVHAESDDSTAILKYKQLMIKTTKTGWQNIPIVNIRLHGKLVIIQIQDVDTPELARTYIGKKIAVLRSQLPTLKPNEYYWTDLEGLTVINEQNENLGTIHYLFRTGSNDVIVTQGDRERMIPFISQTVILGIDFKNQVMHVNWEAEF
jgi:16S rRNA processing protein RimM